MPNKNKVGDKVSMGTKESSNGGDTGVLPKAVYYCGQNKRQCRCGGCDGVCGPYDGCPCNDCVEILGWKVNRDGHLAKRGSGSCSDGGDTGREPKDLFYCGKTKFECRCGQCHDPENPNGWCGPAYGCPCVACLELVGLRPAVRARVGHINTRSNANITRGLPPQRQRSPPPQRVTVGYLVLDSSDEEEDWITPPSSNHSNTSIIAGTSSRAAANNGTIAGARANSVPRTRIEGFINRVGANCRRGTSGLPGGSTMMDAGQVLYCGRKKTQKCHCKDRRYCEDQRCGPTAGCPCDPCLELTFDLVLPKEEPKRPSDKNNNRPKCNCSQEDKNCVICMEKKKTHILIPCGHYSYCEECLKNLRECALCRVNIKGTMKVYEH